MSTECQCTSCSLQTLVHVPLTGFTGGGLSLSVFSVALEVPPLGSHNPWNPISQGDELVTLLPGFPPQVPSHLLGLLGLPPANQEN